MQSRGVGDAVLKGLAEEFESFFALLRLGLIFLHQNERRRCHRPGFGAWLVVQERVEAICPVPLGKGCRRGERGLRRAYRLAGVIDHTRVGQVVLLGIGIFDIADRVFGLADVAGNAFIALGANARRPFDRGAGADLGLPVHSTWRDSR